MNPINASAQHPASLQCNVTVQLQIVSNVEASPTARSHDERVDLQRQIDYAWCAGFLDGEGCVSLARVRRTCGNRVNYRARVQVIQNCLQTLLTFRDSVHENCVLSQVPHRETYTRPIYQLAYDGSHAYQLLQKLRPYLRISAHRGRRFRLIVDAISA
jgi:hypothetical protein